MGSGTFYSPPKSGCCNMTAPPYAAADCDKMSMSMSMGMSPPKEESVYILAAMTGKQLQELLMIANRIMDKVVGPSPACEDGSGCGQNGGVIGIMEMNRGMAITLSNILSRLESKIGDS